MRINIHEIITDTSALITFSNIFFEYIYCMDTKKGCCVFHYIFLFDSMFVSGNITHSSLFIYFPSPPEFSFPFPFTFPNLFFHPCT